MERTAGYIDWPTHSSNYHTLVYNPRSSRDDLLGSKLSALETQVDGDSAQTSRQSGRAGSRCG